jgi:hypothetical protein
MKHREKVIKIHIWLGRAIQDIGYSLSNSTAERSENTALPCVKPKSSITAGAAVLFPLLGKANGAGVVGTHRQRVDDPAYFQRTDM